MNQKYQDQGTAATRILDLAAQVKKNHHTLCSDFLDPPLLQHCTMQLNFFAGVEARAFGGYPAAERRRLVLAPEGEEPGEDDAMLALVQIKPHGAADLGHRDFLGAILGLGVRREKVGDVVVQDGFGQVFLDRDLAGFVAGSLERVGAKNVRTEVVSLADFEEPSPAVELKRITVPSLRLDAVLAHCFALSRSEAAALISSGKVQLNWRLETKPSRDLQMGEVISVRGRGRAEIKEIGGITKKGRQALLVEVKT